MPKSRPSPPLSAARTNDVINSLITNGRYQDAIDLATRVDAQDRDDTSRLLIEINVAEAEYNQGRWDLAEARMLAFGHRCERAPITRAGCRLQKAWILAHTSRGAEAVALCDSVDFRWLPEPYQAEHFFTCAASALAAFDFETAERHMKDSEDKILRPSSVRNYLFLAARLAHAQGDDLKAEALCREAAENTYTGQGGDGLVLWGDLLIKRGDLPGARLAWRLARERDPESAWAQVAKGRLV